MYSFRDSHGRKYFLLGTRRSDSVADVQSRRRSVMVGNSRFPGVGFPTIHLWTARREKTNHQTTKRNAYTENRIYEDAFVRNVELSIAPSWRPPNRARVFGRASIMNVIGALEDVSLDRSHSGRSGSDHSGRRISEYGDNVCGGNNAFTFAVRNDTHLHV